MKILMLPRARVSMTQPVRLVRMRPYGRAVHRAMVKDGRIIASVQYTGTAWLCMLVRPYRKPLSKRAMERRLVFGALNLLHVMDDMAGEPRRP